MTSLLLSSSPILASKCEWWLHSIIYFIVHGALGTSNDRCCRSMWSLILPPGCRLQEWLHEVLDKHVGGGGDTSVVVLRQSSSYLQHTTADGHGSEVGADSLTQRQQQQQQLLQQSAAADASQQGPGPAEMGRKLPTDIELLLQGPMRSSLADVLWDAGPLQQRSRMGLLKQGQLQMSQQRQHQQQNDPMLNSILQMFAG